MPATRRRYDKRTKLAAVMAAEMSSLTEASETTGIPKSTIVYWLDDPQFAQVRTKTREDLADEVKVAAHLAWKRVIQAMPSMEPRDAIFAAEKATTLQVLLSGGATVRTETRDITGTISDAELDAALREAESIATHRGGETPAPGEAEA